MKYRLIIAFVLLLLLPNQTYANDTSSVDRLDKLSNEVLQMVKLQRYDDAKTLLDYFSSQFEAISTQEKPFTSEQLRILTLSHEGAVEATANSSMAHSEKMNQVTKFRLVMDAITSPRHPLWIEMEGPVMGVLADVKEAAYLGDKENFHTSLNHFLSLYDVIYPSMKMNLSMTTIQQLDAKVTYVDKYRQQLLSETQPLHELDALEADLQYLFQYVEEDEADPSLWWVIITTGSIIVLTLSYVGWRKYRGESRRDEKRGHRANHKN